jgi:hypothetical protein
MGQLHVVRHVAEQRATGDSITSPKAELNNEDSNEDVEAVKKENQETVVQGSTQRLTALGSRRNHPAAYAARLAPISDQSLRP